MIFLDKRKAFRKGRFFHAKKEVRYVGKLTDRQRKQIIAEYVAGDGKISQRELAERYQVSQKTISKILGAFALSQP